MPTLRKELAEFVTHRMAELNLSNYDVERRSGNAISHGTVWNIQNERVKTIEDDTITALAKALDVEADDLFALTREPAPQINSEAEKKLERIALRFGRIKKPEAQSKAHDLLDLIDRELERLGKI